MRVLHFSQSLPGGPASYVQEIARYQIASLGIENVLFVLPKIHRALVPDVPDQCFVGFESTKRSLTSLVHLAASVSGTIGKFNPDIIHLHSSFAGAIVRFPALLRKKTKGIVYCPHGWAFAGRSGRIGGAVYSLVERILAYNTDVIINVSEHEYASALSAGIPRERMTIIRNGIGELAQKRAGPNANVDGNKLNLLFVGRHDPQKGLDILLEAMKNVERVNLHLHVIGAPVVSKDTGKNLDLPNVTFHGWLDRDRVNEFISGVDAVVMPSRWEAFGLVAIEAMRLGKPVIASNRGGVAGNC